MPRGGVVREGTAFAVRFQQPIQHVAQVTPKAVAPHASVRAIRLRTIIAEELNIVQVCHGPGLGRGAALVTRVRVIVLVSDLPRGMVRPPLIGVDRPRNAKRHCGGGRVVGVRQECRVMVSFTRYFRRMVVR